MQFLQYMLSILSSFISSIPPVTVDGIYGQNTRAAVLAAQRRFGLPETGTVGATTWDTIYDQYSGIENTAFRSAERFPMQNANAAPAASFQRNRNTNGSARSAYARTTTLEQFPGRALGMGEQDPIRQEVVR